MACLKQSYTSRLETLVSGPESYMNIKKSLSEIDLQRLVDSSPVLKAQDYAGTLQGTFRVSKWRGSHSSKT